MFCPNCGKECRKFIFCPECGNKVQSEPTRRPQQTTTERDTDKIPCGLYNAVTSSLELCETECILRATILFFKKYEARIPYKQIRSVVYVRPLCKMTSVGHLLIRYEGNKDVPIPKDNNFSADHTTVTTSKLYDNVFYHIFHVLKMVAPDTAVFKMIKPTADIPGLDELAAKTDLDWYFAEYAPYRQLAVEAMCRRTGATQEAATELINRVFDVRQEELYEKDPSQAIRDFNIFLDKNKKRDKQIEAERKENLLQIGCGQAWQTPNE